MSDFRAYRWVEDEGRSRGELARLSIDELDPGAVLIRTLYTGVNYKDALAATGKAPVIKRFPCVGGIEAVGEVLESSSPDFKPGDPVIVHGRGLGVQHHGGFAEYVRVPAEWVVPLPEGLSMEEAAVMGVAGHTAALAIDLMEHNGLMPGKGPVAVSGATGGVASLAIDMLAGAGYEVVAVSRKAEQEAYLRSLGATEIVPTPDASSPARPLESARWAGAVDAAGGHVLAWLLSGVKPGGAVACFGNAAGIELNTTVLPFILRGVRLLGVNADTEPEERRRLWHRMATDLKPRHLDSAVNRIGLDELPAVLQRMADGQSVGRHVVCFQ